MIANRAYSPPRRGGVDAPKAQTGWSDRRNVLPNRPPRCCAPPLCEEGNTFLRISHIGQNMIFAPNWICRCAPVCDWKAAREIVPKELLEAIWFGSEKFA